MGWVGLVDHHGRWGGKREVRGLGFVYGEERVCKLFMLVLSCCGLCYVFCEPERVA